LPVVEFARPFPEQHEWPVVFGHPRANIANFYPRLDISEHHRAVERPLV
jgi:hypothetical protein